MPLPSDVPCSIFSSSMNGDLAASSSLLPVSSSSPLGDDDVVSTVFFVSLSLSLQSSSLLLPFIITMIARTIVD